MGCGSNKATEIKEVKKENVVLQTEMDLNEPKKEEEEKKEEEKEEEKKEEEEEELLMLKEILEYTIEELEEFKRKEKQEMQNKQEIEEKEEEIQEDINAKEEENLEDNILYSNDNIDREGQLEENQLEINNNLEKLENNNNNKKRKKLDKKKPFIIMEITTDPPKVKIIINACSFCDEYMMPIWCQKDTFIKFKVEGKWRIDKLCEYTNSKGILSNQTGGFNNGALLGRVGYGESFVVYDKQAILIKKEGPLFLRQNLPKRINLQPEGKLEVTIVDGIYMDIKEINDKIGWIENGTIESNNEDDKDENNENNNSNNKSKKIYKGGNKKKMTEKELEKKLRTYINNLRMNPSMFYEKYLSFNKSLIITKKYLDKLNKKHITSLVENDICYNFIKEYFELPKQKELQKNSNKNNIIQKLIKLDEDIQFFFSDKYGYNIKVKSKLTQKDNPVEIITLFLLDEKYRPYIFSNKSKFLTIKIFNNFLNQTNLIISAIILDDKNNNNNDYNENNNNNNDNDDNIQEYNEDYDKNENKNGNNDNNDEYNNNIDKNNEKNNNDNENIENNENEFDEKQNNENINDKNDNDNNENNEKENKNDENYANNEKENNNQENENIEIENNENNNNNENDNDENNDNNNENQNNENDKNE